MTLYECHRAMLRDRKRDVFQNTPEEIAAHNCVLLERVTVHNHTAKF